MEEIGVLSLGEYKAAFTTWNENKQAESRERFESSRLQAVWIINATSTILKKQLDKPQDLYLFPWEEKPVLKKQSPEEMKKAMQKIALAFGTVDKQEKVTPKQK